MAKEYRVPDSTVSESGDWLTYPNDGVLWDKLDDSWMVVGYIDGDATYIESDDADRWVKLGFTNFTLTAGLSPAYVRMYVAAKKTGAACNILFGYGFGEAALYSEWIPITDNYAVYSYMGTLNPITGNPLTSNEVNSLVTADLFVDDPGGRITAVWLEAGVNSPRQTAPVEDIITLQAIRNVEMANRGHAFVDEEGNFVYKSRFARNP